MVNVIMGNFTSGVIRYEVNTGVTKKETLGSLFHFFGLLPNLLKLGGKGLNLFFVGFFTLVSLITNEDRILNNSSNFSSDPHQGSSLHMFSLRLYESCHILF
jgi:hypothetical protein